MLAFGADSDVLKPLICSSKVRRRVAGQKSFVNTWTLSPANLGEDSRPKFLVGVTIPPDVLPSGVQKNIAEVRIRGPGVDLVLGEVVFTPRQLADGSVWDSALGGSGLERVASRVACGV